MKLYHNWQYSRGWRTRILLGLLLTLLFACNRANTETVVVTRVVVIEGQESVVTQLVRQTLTPTPDIANVAPGKPVTLDLSYLGDVPNIDPHKTASDNGINLVENLFIGLTNFNHAANAIEPELAQSWEVSADGRIWTFHLRDDIFWVKPNESGIIVDGIQQAEAMRMVTAGDMVYATQRACRRETGTPDAFILFLIEGCEQIYGAADPTPADLDAIGVRALDDVTLQFTLTKPASYFLTITSMWLFHPVPPELVEELGDDWLTAEPIWTSGPFMPVSPLKPGGQSVLHRNTLWPLPRRGNADAVNILYFDDAQPAYQLWQAKSLDVSPIPASERNALLSQSPQKVMFVTDQTVFYLGFNFDSGAFREPLVRQAFSAAIDRDRLVEEIYAGQSLGMRHLSPPGIMAAPPIGDIGVGYSPDDARHWLAQSGFQSCRLMPPFTFLATSSDLSLRQAELIRDMWVEELGCSPDQINIEQAQFGTLLANTRRDAGAARPDVWELGWASYFPDAHNWVGDLLHCVDSENRQNRPCSDVDGLIRQAAGTLDPTEREALYRQIEDLLFGGEGIFPLAPLYVRGDETMTQSWLEYTPALFGGEQYDTYLIHAELKELERSRE
ncbi:MAG: peptide ABC transporter substrate-binding protein [Chloroflexi bacterium]|nr:peptide ABC transporter substrate-binding protein [Chloroflexota bacterium]